MARGEKQEHNKQEHNKRGNKKRKPDFDEFYAELFPSRWPELREAMLADGNHMELTEGLRQPYFLDEASYRVALALEPQPGDSVLDMCAAPGGKALVLASAGTEISLTANEKSGTRRERLRRVLREHLTEEQLERIRVTGHDATLWFRYETEAYDKILLDVPCSSERHVLNSPSHLKRWSPARSTHLALQAFAMLASALEAVKAGGIILYSTCALSPAENDGVVGKLFDKRSGRFEILPLRLPFGEETRYGWQVLPDTAGGRGPMFAAKVRRKRQ
jgi:16S rRNA C967 or C1407 C5-methylase (RsmB/RsmF family)